MKIISISGLDGSGKSTQINLLKNYLESQGKKVFYFHAIEFSLAAKITNFKNNYCLICKLLKKCKVKSAPKSVISAYFLQISMRKLFLHIDLWRFNLLRNKLRNQKYEYILSDRYFYDTLINIEYLSKKKINYNYLIVKPNVSIYLQTDPQLIMQRDRTPDQGLQYLLDKKIIYDKLATILDMKIVDGNANQDDVQEKIKSLL